MMTMQYFQASRPVQHMRCLTEECTRYTSNALFFRRYLGPRCPWITDHGKALPCWVYMESCFSQCSQALPHYTANTDFSREIYLFLIRFVFWHRYLSENTRVITLAFFPDYRDTVVYVVEVQIRGISHNRAFSEKSSYWKTTVLLVRTLWFGVSLLLFICILRRASIAWSFFKNSFYIYMLCSTLGFVLVCFSVLIFFLYNI